MPGAPLSRNVSATKEELTIQCVNNLTNPLQESSIKQYEFSILI